MKYITMAIQRCPKCNKILSPQESVCSNCGAKLDNHAIGRINSIYHKSNVITLIYLAIFFVTALIYGFVNWILAAIVFVVLIAISVYLIFIRK